MRVVLPLVILWLSTAPASGAELEALPPGAPVRLRTRPPDSTRLVGHLIRRDADRLTVSAGGAEREFRLAALERLEVRTGRYSGRGAMIGGLIGAGIGMVIAHRAGNGMFADAGSVMAIVTGSLGGVIGGSLVGAQVRSWERVPLPGPYGSGPGRPAPGPVVRVGLRW